tara:strand:- start:187 stop:411 length:225 start_codon:yes stop_codon:yes gene_type:complete
MEIVDPDICAYCLQQQPGFGHIASSSSCLCHLIQTYQQQPQEELAIIEYSSTDQEDDGEYVDCEDDEDDDENEK